MFHNVIRYVKVFCERLSAFAYLQVSITLALSSSLVVIFNYDQACP